ncbi:MAG: transcriptional regulator [Gallionellales bacterium RIFCSPLOWO2_12_FULL_59_22]|nr:MAG: transcriptional regulator [Gallionellales bacterium RIFCSPLOWO2_02_FULL_59_110]OGT04136.1 MAG: transcriptional regulator [Gallionellales bacterium RIFCSPLOWO2_02_58_13]OGT10108.1 MAG: transcriptional regulator [Gallionellales bacterium RIFCSPLOWO2_12_FULL_59_22]
MLNFTLRQLQVFEKVASHLNYSRAAEELYLSQPAVSMQIKQLEGHIGLPLFEQMGKKIFLTEAGRELFHYSRNIAQQLAEMEVVFDEMKGLGKGRLTLSVVNTANYFTPQLLAKFCRLHPNINVTLQVANRAAVLKQLADNSTDLAVMGRPPEGLDIDAEPFMDNPLVVIAAPEHPLARLKRVRFSQLAPETFLSREPGSGTRSAMERVFAQHSIQPHIGMEMETNEAIKQAVRAGMGLGILSLHSIELELETKRLAVVNVEDFPLLRHWFVVHRANKRLSGAAAAFKEFLLGEAGKTISSGPTTGVAKRRN